MSSGETTRVSGLHFPLPSHGAQWQCNLLLGYLSFFLYSSTWVTKEEEVRLTSTTQVRVMVSDFHLPQPQTPT